MMCCHFLIICLSKIDIYGGDDDQTSLWWWSFPSVIDYFAKIAEGYSQRIKISSNTSVVSSHVAGKMAQDINNNRAENILEVL